MRCPVCNGDTRVIDSRETRYTRRRRRCVSRACSYRFTTIELMVETNGAVTVPPMKGLPRKGEPAARPEAEAE